MVNSKALDRSIRHPAQPQPPRCLVNYQLLFMLCKPLRIVLTPLEYEKNGIFEIAKGPGWHLKPVKLNPRKFKKINNVGKIKKTKKVRKKELAKTTEIEKAKKVMIEELPKTTEINVPKPRQDAEEDSIADRDFISESIESVVVDPIFECIESVVMDPIFECIESVVHENSEGTEHLKNSTTSPIKSRKKKKSGLPVANKDRNSTRVVAVSKKNKSKTPLVAVANKDQSKTPVVAVENQDQSKTPVVAVENQDQSKTPMVAVENKDLRKTPLLPVVNKDQIETLSVSVANEEISKTPTVIVSKKNETEKISDKRETIATHNKTTNLDLPVLRNVLQQHDQVISSSDDDDDFTDTYVPAYDDLSTDEEPNTSSEVDDPLPRKEVKVTPRNETDVLTVPPITNPERNPTPDIVNEPKRFKCKQCELSFLNERQLRIHELTHYPEDMVQPADCNVEKVSSDEFDKEFKEPPKKKKRRGIKGEIIKCKFCPAVFTHRKTLNIHEAAHKNKREFKYFCDVSGCNAGFVDKSGFNYHRKLAHTLKKTYRCKVCDKSFKTNPVLKTHMLVHTDKKRFKCKKCDQSFKHKSSLDRHIPLHKKPKNFPCKFCSQSFLTALYVKQHLISNHSVEFEEEKRRKKFKCVTCGALFRTLDNLTNHLNIHSGDRPFLCDQCPLGFRSPASLRSHQYLRHHGKTINPSIQIRTNYSCKECGEPFKWKRLMNRHVKKVHGPDPWLICEICSKEVKKSSMTKHMKRHAPKKSKSATQNELSCNQCPFIAKYKCHLKKHVQIKHTDEKPYKCKLCPAEFRCNVILKRHKATHNNNNIIEAQNDQELNINDQIDVVETFDEEIVDDPNFPSIEQS